LRLCSTAAVSFCRGLCGNFDATCCGSFLVLRRASLVSSGVSAGALSSHIERAFRSPSFSFKGVEALTFTCAG